MDLIQALKKVEEKDRRKQQLLGQKSMLVDSLKSLGFKNIGEAKKFSHKLSREVDKMKEQYEQEEAEFIEQFGHLLS